jgi:multimeric flavodoxin WrbA
MKIIGIISSPHKNGSTSKLVREALRGAQDAGAEIDDVNISELDIEYCVGCLQCLATENCILKDDLNTLREKVLQADGIILGSPTYEADMNARMKNFFDRIMPFTSYRSAMHDKYIATISTAGAFGAKDAAKRMTVLKMGFHKTGNISGTLGVPVGAGDIEAFLPKAYRLGKKIVSDIQLKKSYTFQSLVQKFIFRLFVRTKMEKMIIAYKDGTRKGVYDYLVKAGLIKV